MNEHDQSGRHEPEGWFGDPPPHVFRQLFDRESLAEYLRLSTDTVDRLVKAGKLPCVRIGQQVRFTFDDVERFIDSNRRLGSATG